MSVKLLKALYRESINIFIMKSKNKRHARPLFEVYKTQF